MAAVQMAVERSAAVRFQPGRELWVRSTGERVEFKWLTLTGVRVSTSSGDVTLPESALCTRVPVLGPSAEPAAAPVERPARKTARKRVQRGRTAKPARAVRASKAKREKPVRATLGVSCLQCGKWVSGAGASGMYRHLVRSCKAIPPASENVDWEARERAQRGE